MASITLDIATRFLGEFEDIYVIRPGDGFSLYDEFLRKRAVFLDFPDIRLPFAGKPPGRDELRQAVVRSMAIRDWHRGDRVGAEPSREPAAYLRAAYGRRIGRYVGAIDRLYYKLKEGTILMVPGPGYFTDVLIGELVGPPVQIGDVELYPNEMLPARRIRWLAQTTKAKFSEPLRDLLQRPLPLVMIERSLREEVLQAAFDQYAIGDEFSARLRTTDEDFSTLDDYNIQTFLTYVSGVLAAVEDGSDRKKPMDMNAALEVLRNNRDLVLELNANINSPGALRLFSKRIAVITAVALFAIAMNAQAQPSSIEVKNSAVAGDDPCALTVKEQALKAIQLMDIDTWHRVCVQARDAAKSAGLATTIKVLKKSDKQ